jgi:hypothetical protein
MKKAKLQHIRSANRLNRYQLGVFALLFAVIGVVSLLVSHAAGFSSSFEAENSTINPPTTTVADANASGGSALKFSAGGSGSCALPSYPDETCTGIQHGITLTSGPGITATTAGAIIQNCDVPWIDVKAPNVTIRNCHIHGDSPYLIYNFSTGLLVEDSVIDGEQNPGNGISPANYTLRRVNILGVENGVDISDSGNVTVEDCYIHMLRNTATSHTDGIQLGQGSSNIVIRHNNIRVQDSGTPNSNAAIIMWTKADPQNSNVRIENNRLDGSRGTYTLFAPQSPASQIYINNNRILPGIYGYTTGVNVPTTVTEFNGNVDDTTGAPLNSN